LPRGGNTLYHQGVAVRKGNVKKSPAKTASGGRRGKKPSGKSWAVLFWLVFVIVLFGFYIFNRGAIGRSLEIIKTEFAARKIGEEKPAGPVPDLVRVAPEDAQPSARPTPPATPAASSPPPAPTAASPPATSPVSSAPSASTPPPAAVSQPAPNAVSPAVRPPEQQERALYFIQVDRDGSILRIKVNRGFPPSDSPMTDMIQALIAGPNAAEKQRGLISLVPPNTRILSAAVRGSTAHISFSEDFLYNTYGAEGYAGQIRQIVYTATEFANVNDVQILIEGRMVDYLGAGIWIGGPLRRE
jgi:spore germination protein GerM